MRILLVHNFYQSSAPSGEDVVFHIERQLLERAGHEVITYTRANDEIGSSLGSRMRAATDLYWSPSSYRDITRLLRERKPDVAHFHNTFPLVSVSGYRACQEHGVPVVQTLHNYRLICPGALLQRNGVPCEDCIGKLPTAAAIHGCYRDSRLGSALVGGMLAVNRARGVYRMDVNRYLCLTQFARTRFIRGGLPAAQLFVKPNTLLDPPGPGDGSGDYALYVGRLTREKGVATLIEAWRSVDLPLWIVGEGSLRAELEERARASGVNVRFLGLRTKSEVYDLLRSALLLMVPSEWYEGFPMTVLEALASGTPMLVSRLGAMDEVLTAGRHCQKFEAGNPDALRGALLQMLSDPDALAAMRTACRAEFDLKYAQSIVTQQAVDHYRSLAGLPRARQPH